MQTHNHINLDSTVEKFYRAHKQLLFLAASLLFILFSAFLSTTEGNAAVKITTTIKSTQSGSGEVSLRWSHQPVSPTGQKLLIEKCNSSCTGARAKFIVQRTITLDPAATLTVIKNLTNQNYYRFTLITTSTGSKSTASTKLMLVSKPKALSSASLVWEDGELVANWSGITSKGSISITINSNSQVPIIRSISTPGTSTKFIGLDPLSQYSVTFTPVNSAGVGPSITQIVKPLNPTTSFIEGLPLSSSSIQLSWDGVAASNWIIAIDAPGLARDGSIITLGGSTKVTVIAGLTPASSYRFSITPSNSSGSGLPLFSKSYTTLTPVPVLYSPTQLLAESLDGEVRLKWSSSNSFAPANYLVEYRSVPSQQWVNFTTTPSQSVIVTGLTNGQLYDFQVSSLVDGSSPQSSQIYFVTVGSVIPTLNQPSEPEVLQLSVQGLQIESGDTYVLVKWSYLPSQTRLQWKTETESVWSNSPITASSFTISGLSNGVTYYIRFVDSTGVPISNLLQAFPVGPPSTPINLSFMGSANSITADWSPPNFDGGSPITSYIFTISTRAGIIERYIIDSPAPTTFNGLIDGELYIISVFAVNRYGESEPNSIIALAGAVNG